MKRLIGWVKEKKKVVAGAMAAFAVAVVISVSGPAATPAAAAPVDFTGVTLPFTVADMLGTATNFLTMYGPWIGLALGVLFAPVLFSLAMKLINAVRAKMSKT